jgi:hypothetical protein
LKVDNDEPPDALALPAGNSPLSTFNFPLSIRETIFAHPEFTAFTTKARKLFTKWQMASVPLLKGLAKGGHSKPLIETIAEDLLATFKTAPLLDEKREEQSGEEGLLAEIIEGEGEKQKITAKALKARLKDIGRDPDYADERQALEDYSALLDQQTDVKARLKATQDDLEAKLDAKYPTLTEDEIKTLVVDDKWLATLAAAVQGELDRVSQTLTGRIRQLAERYTTPLPSLEGEVSALASKVAGHLGKMGFTP